MGPISHFLPLPFLHQLNIKQVAHQASIGEPGGQGAIKRPGGLWSAIVAIKRSNHLFPSITIPTDNALTLGDLFKNLNWLQCWRTINLDANRAVKLLAAVRCGSIEMESRCL